MKLLLLFFLLYGMMHGVICMIAETRMFRICSYFFVLTQLDKRKVKYPSIKYHSGM